MRDRAFNHFVADATRVPPKTVVVFARALKEAGLLTTGERGTAPQMQPEDAATIIIAMLATDSPARAVERLRRFRDLPFRSDLSKGEPSDNYGLHDGVTIHEALTRLFSADHWRTFGDAPYVVFDENARRARIEHKGGELVFMDTERSEGTAAADRSELFGIRRSRGLASSDLMKLQIPFYLERRDGKPWEEIAKGSDVEGYPLDPSHPWNSGVYDV